jgi:hypothetical protein
VFNGLRFVILELFCHFQPLSLSVRVPSK